MTCDHCGHPFFPHEYKHLAGRDLCPECFTTQRAKLLTERDYEHAVGTSAPKTLKRKGGVWKARGKGYQKRYTRLP